MFKKLLIGALSTLVVGAIGVSAYNNVAAPSSTTNQSAVAANQAAVSDSAAQQAGWGNPEAAGNGNQAGQAGLLAQEALQSQAGNRQAGNPNGYQAGTAALNPEAQGAAIQGSTGLGTASQSGAGPAGAGQGGARQQGGSQGNVNGTGIPDPQNSFAELVTFSGTVEAYNPPSLTLTSDDGQLIPVELGNMNYVAGLNLAITVGERLTVTGSWDTQGGFAASQVTEASSGVTYALRDELGRPLWRGGNGGGNK